MKYNLKKTAKIGLLALPVAIGVGVAGVTLMPQAHAAAQTNASVSNQAADKPDEGTNDAADAAVQNTPVKLTADQAKKVAEASVKGTASSVIKEDENGTIVYNVKVAGNEVKVDANNGKVLAADTEASSQSEQHDAKDVNSAEDQSKDTPEANDVPDSATQKQ